MIPSIKEKNISKQTRKKGFTLVEMVVVIALFGFLASAMFARNSSFNSSVLLTNLAYEVALSIRQAQVYGLSVRETAVGSDNFEAAYGINFNRSNALNYILFMDRNAGGPDGLYNGGTELLQTFTLKRGNKIGKICATTTLGSVQCSDTGTLAQLHISFKRPNPDAIIKTNLGSSYRSATIHIVSPSGSERVISVEQTGQISIEQPGT